MIEFLRMAVRRIFIAVFFLGSTMLVSLAASTMLVDDNSPNFGIIFVVVWIVLLLLCFAFPEWWNNEV